MKEGLTPSEKFVIDLSKRAFLRLWTHPNPIGKNGKELCDCLIVCDKHIIVISVKESEYKDTGDITGIERWKKKALHKSYDQIYGAERWLESQDNITRNDGREVTLPKKADRIFHRISVSIGGEKYIPISIGDQGKGYIHVLDSKNVDIIFNELDTITDFITFLSEVEKLTSETKIIFNGGGIENLLPYYITNDYYLDFKDQKGNTPDLITIEGDTWSEFYKSEDYKVYKRELKESYFWDGLIEIFVKDLLNGDMFNMHNKEVTDNELVFVTMALQPRIIRAKLAKNYIELITQKKLKIKSRLARINEDTVFVFLVGSSAKRKERSEELLLRCTMIKGILRKVKTIVGIASDLSGKSKVGYSSDFVYLYLPKYFKKLGEGAKMMQEKLGYFTNLIEEDE